MTTEARYLSSVPYFPDTHKLEIMYSVKVFADMVEIQALFPPKREPPKPDPDEFDENGFLLPKPKVIVKGFSDKSRKRMIDFIAKTVDTPDLFCTLTYSDDIVENAHVNLHRDLEVFRKRLERAYAGIRAVWRVEFVPRKSGAFYGKLQPHFHLLVWLPKSLQYNEIELILKDDGAMWRAWWHDLTGSTNSEHLRYYGCQVQKCMSRKHAYAYVSKYVAKGADENITAGRRWGVIGKFEHPVDIDTGLTARAYIELKRMLNRYMKRKCPKFYKQFRKMSIHLGSSVYGLGFLSQEKVIGATTIARMIRHARELACQYSVHEKILSTA